MSKLEINGRVFRDLDAYNAAKRDYANIDRLKERTNLTDIVEVTKLRDTIIEGRYRFETMVGEDFIDELDEIIKDLKSSNENTSKNKKDTVKQKKESGKKRHSDNNDKRMSKKSFDEYDSELQREIINLLKKKEIKRRFITILMVFVVLACVGYLVFYYFMYAKNDNDYKELSKLRDEVIATKEYSVNISNEDKSLPPILKKYETLYQKNKKIVGWIKIDGTTIDYPVMQTVNNEYYLDHNYNQDYDKNGSIFMDKDCDPAFPNDNMIIYGHHMKSGKMFGNLGLYAKESYYKDHPYITFDTIYEEGTYEIMYVFRSRIYSEEEIVFKYYKFIDATSENEFYSNMDEMQKIALYDTGVTAKYGDRLITLSTCDYEEANGRFVVVAKKIK